MTNETETIDSQNDDQQEVLDVSNEEQDVEVLRQQAKDLAEKNRQLFARAKKAEGFILKDDKWVKPEPKPETKPEPVAPQAPAEARDLNAMDAIALMRANIHEEDIGEVVEYARFKGVSVAEALKASVIKATLAEKAEQRQTASATSTGRVRSGSVQKSGEGLLEKAFATGEIPDSDKDMEALASARLERGLKR